jgi:hypothetical protein
MPIKQLLILGLEVLAHLAQQIPENESTNINSCSSLRSPRHLDGRLDNSHVKQVAAPNSETT